jgi:hypothetical protein
MQISVKRDGPERQFEVSDTATVSDLLALTAAAFELPVDRQKLIFRGKTLAPPSAALSSFGIKQNSRLMLVGSTPTPAAEKPVQIPISSPAPVLEYSMRALRFANDEYMTAPPHSTIIQQGAPPKTIPGSSYQLESLPAEPFVVRESVGDEATLSFRSDDLVVDSEANHHRLFYQEITSFGIQLIPGQEQSYLAVVFHIKGKKLWVYFVPRQYRSVIESVLQHRRA